jgi:Flp pilus assembly protein TadG
MAMTPTIPPRTNGQRGSVLIQVAVAMLALLAICSFVFDYGVMWVSRGQAQTAADAGALSGAISLAYGSPTDFAGARLRAITVAQQNAVWGAPPSVTDADVTFPACPPGAPGLPDTCVKVNVFRNQARANALPTYFGRAANVLNQGVRATATAQIATGDTTDCLRPWAVVDRWNEFGPEGPTPGPLSTYDKYSNGQGNNPPQENDVYIPPSASGPGTGFSLPRDIGARFAVKIGASGSPISSGWFRTIDLPRADTTQLGNNTVQSNILTCNGLPSSFAGPTTVCPTDIPTNWADTAYWAARGCYRVQTGATVGSTRNTVQDLMARDSGASWVNGQGIVGSSFDPPSRSPRVVPIGVMDIDSYMAANPTGQNGVLRMVNIFGFFIEGIGDIDRNTGQIIFPSNNGQAVIGRIMTLPSTAVGNSSLPNSASFLRTILLVR